MIIEEVNVFSNIYLCFCTVHCPWLMRGGALSMVDEGCAVISLAHTFNLTPRPIKITRWLTIFCRSTLLHTNVSSIVYVARSVKSFIKVAKVQCNYLK